MKKLLSIITVLTIIISLSACHHGPHTVIVYRNNNHEVKVEYAGLIAFDQGFTRITGLSRNGYVEYSTDDRKISAESGPHDGIVYQLNNGDKTTQLNGEGKSLLAEAVKAIAKQQGKIK